MDVDILVLCSCTCQFLQHHGRVVEYCGTGVISSFH